MPKATRPMVKIHDVDTQEIIEREMTDDEFESYKLEQENDAKMQKEKAALIEKQSAEKAALLARLGLTEDELKTILG